MAPISGTASPLVSRAAPPPLAPVSPLSATPYDVAPTITCDSRSMKKRFPAWWGRKRIKGRLSISHLWVQLKVPQRPVQAVFPCGFYPPKPPLIRRCNVAPWSVAGYVAGTVASICSQRAAEWCLAAVGGQQSRPHIRSIRGIWWRAWSSSSARGGGTPSPVRLRRAREDTRCEAPGGCLLEPSNVDSAQMRG